ncbi:MAG: preprotein translocase subunit SecE [Myxococcales bacterium]|jgi:preprotein translocase SecE subunit
MSEQETTQDAQAKTLGLARWVQVAYMVFFLFTLWLLDKIVLLTWSLFAEPNPTLVTALCAAAAGALTFYLYRHPSVNRLSYEVVGELAKVTWPSRRETQASTIVVIVASVIAAVILGSFDAVWSAITDLIYEV